MNLLTPDDVIASEAVTNTVRDLVETDLYVITVSTSTAAQAGDVIFFSESTPAHPYYVNVGYVTNASGSSITVKVDSTTMNRPPNSSSGTVFIHRNGEYVGPYTFTVTANYAMATRALVKYSDREEYNINLLSKRLNFNDFYSRYLNGGKDYILAYDCSKEKAWKVAIESMALTSINGNAKSSIPLAVATNKFTI